MIPIRNLYFLLCYAWKRRPVGPYARLGTDEPASLVDLFADVLTAGVTRLMKQGLDRGYVEVEEETPRLKGRIDLNRSARTFSLASGRAWCNFDELSHDVPHNQILRSALKRLARIPSLDADLRPRVVDLYRRMDGVSDVPLSRAAFRQIQLHGNNGFYRFLLHVCRLVLEEVVPGEEPGTYSFQDLRRDEIRMHALFEQFLFNFYRLEQRQFSVKSDRFTWDASGSVDDMAFLPKMDTDISLYSPNRAIIIDAKFYKDTLATGQHKKTVHSGHLYQLMAYLDAAARRSEPGVDVEGVLIYPWIDTTLDLSYVIRGYPVRVVSVDLSLPASQLGQTLLGLLHTSDVDLAQTA